MFLTIWFYYTYILNLKKLFLNINLSFLLDFDQHNLIPNIGFLASDQHNLIPNLYNVHVSRFHVSNTQVESTSAGSGSAIPSRIHVSKDWFSSFLKKALIHRNGTSATKKEKETMEAIVTALLSFNLAFDLVLVFINLSFL